MATAILLGLEIVAYAINPEVAEPNSCFFIVLGLLIVYDIAALFKNKA